MKISENKNKLASLQYAFYGIIATWLGKKKPQYICIYAVSKNNLSKRKRAT
jgi:hypothetical protein